MFDRVGKVASVKINQGDAFTQVVVQPRHELFGQDCGQIKIEYDTLVMEQQDAEFGLVMQSAPKLTPNSFYRKI